MRSEALVKMVGEAGRTVTVSSPGFASRGHWTLLYTDVTVIYQIAAQHHAGLIFFVADDWMLADDMCLTVYVDIRVTKFNRDKESLSEIPFYSMFHKLPVTRKLVLCIVYGCNHNCSRESCKFYRFPANKRTNWGELSR